MAEDFIGKGQYEAAREALDELWQGTGKALLFCGASNVIGFGSLVFSSSDALVSLGKVSVFGILLSMGISIFLLPGWRHGSTESRAQR